MSGDASTTELDQQDNADLADFAAGFDDGTTATPTETPAAQQDDGKPAATTQEEPAEPAPEYVQLTKAERDELFALREQATKQFGTAFGKIGGIERRLQELNSGPQVEISQEDIDALKDDFPPLAAALEKVRNLRGLPGGSVDPDAVASIVEQRVSAVQQRLELRLLAKDHPDYEQIDADPAFAAWVQTQPDEFKQRLAKASGEYDSSVVSDAMTKFKQSRKAAPATPAPDLAAARRSRIAANVTPRGAGGNAAPNPADDFLAGFNE